MKIHEATPEPCFNNKLFAKNLEWNIHFCVKNKKTYRKLGKNSEENPKKINEFLKILEQVVVKNF